MTAAGPAHARPDHDPRRMEEKMLTRKLFRPAVLAFVLTAIVVIAGGCSSGSPSPSASMVAIPDVTGMTAFDAVHALQSAGLLLGSIEQVADEQHAALTVLKQAPGAGGRTEKGSAVDLTVSNGSQLVAVPDVKGMTVRRAVRDLEGLGLTVYQTSTYHKSAPSGTVMGQLPEPGTGVAPAATVGLIISNGKAPAQVAVPGVVGKSATAAADALKKVGLKANRIDVYDAAAPAGKVVRQQPSAKTQVAPGSSVDILVSQGAVPSYVSVPSVVGQPRAAAVQLITRAGLKASTEQRYSSKVKKGYVISQLPDAGSRLAPGEDVGIFVSLGPEPPTVEPGPQTAKVPKVTGKSQKAATVALTRAGFGVKVMDVPTGDKTPGTVVQQFPSGGTTVIAGSEVMIGVARAIPRPL